MSDGLAHYEAIRKELVEWLEKKNVPPEVGCTVMLSIVASVLRAEESCTNACDILTAFHGAARTAMLEQAARS